MEYLFPVDVSILRRLVELERDTGKPYSEAGAFASLYLDMDRGSVRSARSYSRIWRWTRHEVGKRLPEMKARVYEYRTRFGAGSESGAKSLKTGGGRPVGDQSAASDRPKKRRNSLKKEGDSATGRPVVGQSSATTTQTPNTQSLPPVCPPVGNLLITDEDREWARTNAPNVEPLTVLQELETYCRAEGKTYNDDRAAWQRFMLRAEQDVRAGKRAPARRLTRVDRPPPSIEPRQSGRPIRLEDYMDDYERGAEEIKRARENGTA